MRSLRSRLVLGAVVGITLFLGVSGTVIYAVVRNRLYAELDRSLAAIARSTASTVALEVGMMSREGSPPGGLDRSLLDSFGETAHFFHCRNASGDTIARSSQLGEASLPRIATREDGFTYSSITLPDGVAGRAVSFSFRPPPRGPHDGRPRPPPFGPGRDGPPERRAPPPPAERPELIETVVAQPITELLETLGHFRWLLVLSWVACSLGCVLILSWVVHRGLRPLNDLGGQIESLSDPDPNHVFGVSGAPSELVPVIHQLNGLMDRIRQAFDREQAFTNHAAHELRTPLAGLRATLEVILSRQRDQAEYREASEQCLSVTLEMQSMVEDLLDLARLASQSDPVQSESCGLARLLDESWESHSAAATERVLSLVRRIDDGMTIRTDPGLIRRVLENLLENAIEYADEGSAIVVSAELRDGYLMITVSNQAERISGDLAQHVFDPFWRADASRSATGRHAGIGLSLCQRIVEVLGGTIEANSSGGTFSVTIRLAQ